MRPRERRSWNGWKGSDGGVSCDGLPAGGSGIVEEMDCSGGGTWVEAVGELEATGKMEMAAMVDF